MRKDDSGMLSVDFLVGFTIFLISLIIVINMIPGLLLNVQSSSVDYDAVAYRTSVILTEDPGWPYSPAWELEDYDHKDRIQRLGLSVSPDTPNILSTEKVLRFFSKTTDFNFTDDDYRDKAIFGDFPYRFNISLKEDSNDPLFTGEPVPHSRYGYIKRDVKIKHYSSADLPCGDFNVTGIQIASPVPPYNYDNGISFLLEYSKLYDKTMSAAYRIDPKNEPLLFRINGFSQSLNLSEINSVKLTQARFLKDGLEVPMPYGSYDNTTYIYTVDGVSHTMDDEINMIDKSQIEFKLFPTLMFSSEVTSSLSLALNFSYEFNNNGTVIPLHPITGADIPYSYDSSYVNNPYLTDGVVEVCIW